MKNVILTSIFIGLWFISMTGCSPNEQSNSEEIELTVSAAASLKDSLEEVKELFEEEYPHVNVRFNFGGSGSLQQQISQGAPVDIFFSSSEPKFNTLIESGLIDEENNAPLLKNEIVLIAETSNPSNLLSFKDLTNKKIEHIAIGIPETVPAGEYAKETLEYINIWNDVESKIVYAKDVRQVLSYVETGNVGAGIVYRTDALPSDKVIIIESAVPDSHSAIHYPVGIIKGTKHFEAAKDFYYFLQKDDVLEVFENDGFITF
ncbi:molybdate ABC transporter substrate-binding protein [Ornithinibacillus scapharcae]|uniref:molybdate ABC transporter substrate-binding protein n=1 Tax=Ornithinibacillus scapharcae TaxID=1147159 RepID=UPI000225B5F8|nr:molybdate ABC transporter substrate-binding protein [Ornithinibacillus scapharcae]